MFKSSGLLIFALSLILCARPTLAQEETPAPVYKSDVDAQLTLQKVSVLPFTDNLEGIYARPLEAHFIDLVSQMHRWDFVPAHGSGPLLAPEELEADAPKAKQMMEGVGADAFFAVRIVKGPAGITIHTSLFSGADGKLLLQAILKDYKQFDLSSLKIQMGHLLTEIVLRLPYSGRVLSRDSNRVTVNIGQSDGLKPGQVLSVVQITKAQRHPKFNFLVHTEKEILGRVKILKVDETLSFGMIESEKERGAIQKNAKIAPLEFVTYDNTDSLSLQPSGEERLQQRDDGKLAFGKNARAWKPVDPPSFGQIAARFGISRFNENAEVSGVGALSASNVLAPSLTLDGELWVTPEWTIQARLKEGILPISNPRPGSSPSTQNQALTYFELAFGYTLRLGQRVWAPTLEPYFGYFGYRLFVDNSDPLSYTTVNYQGLKIGLRGSSPIEDGRYGVGGLFALALNPSLHESPVSSGDDAKNTVVQFGVSGYKKMSEHFKLQIDLEFEMYSSSLSGDGGRVHDGQPEPASSLSQRYMTLGVGGAYLF